ncbi:DUF6468 domain-containing protein [Roseospira navarrensis]|uniref:DUF6468 domain-containing protein n=1 Tax=Roseospira navarrensis TaxID=140058 RepID=A0A7X1ZDV6_9PROT|nr:DUF6468 domain-containing protein [Roseospira navarrensis]MQX35400.1 hypothetical protein [Roseospira navarrensis]
MELSLILDIVIVVLLVPTILFAWVLNSRLADLRRNRDELARLIGSFNEATHRAEAGIPKLRKAADDAGRALADRVEKAQILRDDLAFMVDRAETTLGKLEDGTRASPRAARSGGGSSSAGQRGDVERALTEARDRSGRPDGGYGSGRSEGAGQTVPAPPPVPGRGAGSRVNGGSGGGGGGGGAQPQRADDEDDFFIEDERSEAERELLRALRSVR